MSGDVSGPLDCDETVQRIVPELEIERERRITRLRMCRRRFMHIAREFSFWFVVAFCFAGACAGFAALFFVLR